MNTQNQKSNGINKKNTISRIDFRNIPSLLRDRKLTLSAGILACSAFTGFIFTTSFQSKPSKETNELVAFVSGPQAGSQKEKYTISETDLLKQHLQATQRELEEYKARLFRSSHPDDQAKIAELGHLLAEKEKLNYQLTTALQTLEKELHSARKHAATLELTTEALTAMLQTQKNQPNDHIAGLTKTFESEKKELIARINSYEGSQSELQSIIDDKHSSLSTLKNTLIKQNQLGEALLQELQDLSTLYATVLHIHQSKEEYQSQILFNEFQATELYSSLLHKYMESEQNNLNKLLQNEQDLVQHLQKKLSSARQLADSQSEQLQKLHSTYQDSIDVASLLEYQIIELHQQSQLLEGQLVSAKKALNEEAKQVELLNQKISAIDLHESMDLEIGLHKAFQEISSLKQELREAQTAKNELADELTGLEDLLGNLKEQNKMSMVQYSLALQESDGLEGQINALLRQIKEHEIALEDSEENVSILQTFIQEITDDHLVLQKENNWLSTQHEDDQELLVQHQEHIKKLKEEYSDTDDALGAALAHYDAKTKEFEDELKAFKARLVSEEEKNDLLQERMNVMIAENTTSTDQTDIAHKNLEEAISKITDLEAALAAQEAVLIAAQLEARGHEETISLMNDKHHAEMAHLAAQEKEKERQDTLLKQEFETMQHELSTDISKLNREIDENLAKNDLLQERMNAMIAENTSNIEKINKAHKNLEEAISKITHLEAALATQEAQAIAAQSEAKEHEEMISFMNSKHHAEMTHLANQEKEKERQEALLKQDFTKMQQEFARDVSRLNHEIDENLAKLDMLTLHIHEITEAKQYSEEKSHLLAHELQKISSRIAEKDQALRSSEKSFQELQDEISLLVHQHSHTNTKLSELEQELAAEREQNRRSQATAHAREGELTAIQIALHDHIQHLTRELEEKKELAEKN